MCGYTCAHRHTARHSLSRAEDWVLRSHRSLAPSVPHQVQVAGNNAQQRLEGGFPCKLEDDPISLVWKKERVMVSFPTAASRRALPNSGYPRSTRSRAAQGQQPAHRCSAPLGPAAKLSAEPRWGAQLAARCARCPAALRTGERGAPGRNPAARPACAARESGSGCRRRRGGLGRGPGQGFLSPPHLLPSRRRFPWGCKCRRGSWGAGGGCCRRPAQRRSKGKSWWRQERPRRRDEVSAELGRRVPGGSGAAGAARPAWGPGKHGEGSGRSCGGCRRRGSAPGPGGAAARCRVWLWGAGWGRQGARGFRPELGRARGRWNCIEGPQRPPLPKSGAGWLPVHLGSGEERSSHRAQRCFLWLKLSRNNTEVKNSNS